MFIHKYDYFQLNFIADPNMGDKHAVSAKESDTVAPINGEQSNQQYFDMRTIPRILNGNCNTEEQVNIFR